MHKVHLKAVLPGHREQNFLLIQAFLHPKGETNLQCHSIVTLFVVHIVNWK
jgi:hypothetical protein